MTEQDKKDFINLFNEGFETVVLPHIEALHTELTEVKSDTSTLKGDVREVREDVATLKEDMKEVKVRLGNIERRQVGEQSMLDNHDGRIGKLEMTSSPHSLRFVRGFLASGTRDLTVAVGYIHPTHAASSASKSTRFWDEPRAGFSAKEVKRQVHYEPGAQK